jgi:hypothetical protein
MIIIIFIWLIYIYEQAHISCLCHPNIKEWDTLERHTVPTGSNAVLLITEKESSQNKWLGGLHFTRKQCIHTYAKHGRIQGGGGRGGVGPPPSWEKYWFFRQFFRLLPKISLNLGYIFTPRPSNFNVLDPPLQKNTYTNKMLPMGTSRKCFLSMYIYLLSRWISIETQRYHILDFWFRDRVFSRPIADMKVVFSISDGQDHSLFYPRRPLHILWICPGPLLQRDPKLLHLQTNESSQNNEMNGLIAFHWISVYQYFMTKKPWSPPHHCCCLFYETPGPCISAAKGCEVRKKEWGSLKVSARLA